MLQRRIPHALGLTACLLLLLALAGCSYQSVRHLDRQPWLLGEARELTLKFWTFRYAATPLPGAFGVQGEASPRLEALPDGGRRLEDLTLSAYLCDRDGRVLARSEQSYLPRDLDGRPAVFEFTLIPDNPPPGPLYVAFGYRMVLGPGGSGQGAFFASEGAVTRR